MIKQVQVLWYLTKDDFVNYSLDFKIYKNHQLEGYEVCDVDEDLIYDLCDINPDYFEVLGFFKNPKEITNFLDSQGVESLSSVDFTGEDYYLSVGEGTLGSSENKIVSWYEVLKKEYSSSTTWVYTVTGYDVYDIAPTGKALTYILSDILNLNESFFDEIIPNKGKIEKEEWNKILDKVYKKRKIHLGLKRVI